MNPPIVAILNLDAIEERAPRSPASATVELIGFAFLFSLCLSLFKEIDQVAAMHENGSSVIDGAKPCLDPTPNGIRMQVKQIGNL